ncbi:MAG: extracellular solute-binding protein, partial [Pseudomonadales bacterium]|nr:extracellular solute-binding protein [Pseudomonadales bacterium]
MLFSGAKEDLWEPLDTNTVDLSNNSIPADPARGGMPLYIYSGGVAWDPARTKNPPKNFREMWDTGSFPGRRALRTRASEMLEVALLADGVKPSEMYPLDIDRAFNSLESIKPHVRKWFDQTGQMVTLIQQNETDFTYAYTNRVRAARKAGISIDISFDQLVNAVAYYAVIRGTPRKEAAMRFLAFVARPEQQAAMAEYLSVSPAFQGADSLISEEARKWKADVTDPNSIVLNDEYWGDKYDEINKRFKEWILI